MIPLLEFQATAADAGRLDRALRVRVPACPMSELRDAVAGGRVQVNGRPAAKGTRLEVGDRVSAQSLLEVADCRIRPDPSLPLAVLRETAVWVACDKPPGQPTHPLEPRETGTLANALVARYPEVAAIGDPPLMGGLLHRLDTDTSGVVLAARTAAAYRDLRAQFRARSVSKVYFALAAGEVLAAGRAEHRLVHRPGDRGQMAEAGSVRSREKPMTAVTHFQPIAAAAGFTLLRVEIRTGVTHQIRCQLALLGHPLAGDARYGGPALPGLVRHFLHAAVLTFRDPSDGLACRVAAPLARDLAALLARLGVAVPEGERLRLACCAK